MERKQHDSTQTKESLRAVLNTSKDDNFTFIENVINNYDKTNDGDLLTMYLKEENKGIMPQITCWSIHFPFSPIPIVVLIVFDYNFLQITIYLTAILNNNFARK